MSLREPLALSSQGTPLYAPASASKEVPGGISANRLVTLAFNSAVTCAWVGRGGVDELEQAARRPKTAAALMMTIGLRALIGFRISLESYLGAVPGDDLAERLERGGVLRPI